MKVIHVDGEVVTVLEVNDSSTVHLLGIPISGNGSKILKVVSDGKMINVILKNNTSLDMVVDAVNKHGEPYEFIDENARENIKLMQLNETARKNIALDNQKGSCSIFDVFSNPPWPF